jgi:UDP-N-acetyl-D-mannosaminuronic acid dehydrogenase
MPDPLQSLRSAVSDRTARLAVVGLGYVGTPVACRFAEAGFTVTGVDVSAERVAALAAGRPPFEGHEPGLEELVASVTASRRLRPSTNADDLRGSEVVLVAVETPVEPGTHQPAYRALRSALASIAPRLAPSALVVVESTLAPGTTASLVVPALEAGRSAAQAGTLYVAHCPERVMPGRLLRNLASMSRVVGGVTPQAAELAALLYRDVVQADLALTDALTAEIVKTAENAYRDVQIAFANEMALLCESVGADVWRARELVNRSPGRAMLLPGAGVGGHCIPKDPWLLVARAGPGFEPRLIPAARSVNDDMPRHVAELVADELQGAGRPLEAARVAVLGAAYLEDSDDDRNAPTAALRSRLEELGAEVAIHDPWVARYRDRSLESCVAGSDAVVVMVAHSAYRHVDLGALRRLVRTPILVDGRRCFEPQAAREAGWRVRTLGVGVSG